MKILFIFLSMVLATSGWAQDIDSGTSYFVVVGAFAKAKESYAKNFKDDLKTQGLKADYVTHGRLILVYIAVFNDFKPSIDEMMATRKQGKFPEAWVKIIKENHIEQPEPLAASAPPPTVATVKAPALAEVKEPVDSSPTIKSEPIAVVIPEETKKPEEIKPEPIEPKGPPTPKNTRVIFYLYDANNNNEEVDGNVEIVDTQRARLIESHKSTDTVSLPSPNSDTGMLSLITNVFGYRQVQREINYKQPIADSTKQFFDLEGDYYVARFEMIRYRKGDIATLYNVFFFNDAAIMMPESKYELARLLDMMKANPGYKILLHGHTNGNASGKIISMGPSKDFFSLKASDVKEGSGSSKELSGQRAEVIRDWLIDQGIAADRMEVKAWGGKRMIHDKNSNNARRNVRVEVEVLAD